MLPTWRYRWPKSRFAWTRLPISNWSVVLRSSLGKISPTVCHQRERPGASMASVTNVYARAFADVVVANRLDPVQTLRQAQSLAALVASSRELREVWHAPSIPAGQKRGVLDAIVS